MRLETPSRCCSSTLICLFTQSYSAMLLGFLVVDSEGSRSAAVSWLRSGSLGTVSASIRRCLDFYSYTGAITEDCKDSLVQLLENLSKCL
jgi:hypothetical protein